MSRPSLRTTGHMRDCDVWCQVVQFLVEEGQLGEIEQLRGRLNSKAQHIQVQALQIEELQGDVDRLEEELQDDSDGDSVPRVQFFEDKEREVARLKGRLKRRDDLIESLFKQSHGDVESREIDHLWQECIANRQRAFKISRLRPHAMDDEDDPQATDDEGEPDTDKMDNVVEELRVRVADLEHELEAQSVSRQKKDRQLAQLRLDLADATRRAASTATHIASQHTTIEQLQEEVEVIRRALDARTDSEGSASEIERLCDRNSAATPCCRRGRTR